MHVHLIDTSVFIPEVFEGYMRPVPAKRVHFSLKKKKLCFKFLTIKCYAMYAADIKYYFRHRSKRGTGHVV